ncbi:peptidyl-prolyl cis-trans isomerase CYP26-2, chloroplastic isoform X2 [Dioscorea cayenensis subsp. rotundata]|nr:peptidyl-prolyl cis-trans isomerase CYP26-2, chloroplastic isoform X2 [Dioscorea cayenensis subsp. rotundata]
MRHLLQSLNPPPHLLNPPSPPPTFHSHSHSPHSPPPPPPPQKLIFRRELAITTISLPLLLPSPSHAQPNTGEDVTTDNCGNQTSIQKAFMDISIDNQPIGRILIGLYKDTAPLGVSRFISLLTGAAGISYRRKEFIRIMPNYIQHGGVRSYGVDAELARKKGGNVDKAEGGLVAEWEAAEELCKGTRNTAGTVGIIVRDPLKPGPKMKLVARQGRLEIDEEEVGKEPNGTEFVIAVKDAPELDASTLVVGKVLLGMEVVESVALVKTVQENTSSPYFR